MNDRNNMFEMLKAIKNPQEFVNNFMKQNNNPMLNNLMQMAQKGDRENLENFANNLLQQQGMSLNDFKQFFK